MSNQRVTPSQGELIVSTIQTMLDKEGMNFKGVFKEFRRWCERESVECDVSSETIRKWCIVAKGEGRTLKTQPKKGGQFIHFAAERQKRLRPDDLEGMLVRSAQQLFGDGNKSSTRLLSRLHGRYLIVRRRWRRPFADDEFTQCVVDFEVTGERAIFRETQKLGSPERRITDLVDEKYTGYAFMFGSNVFIIAREDSRASVKFLTIHHCDPALLNGHIPIATCRGNLIAVCGPGPNQSHRFVLVRTDATTRCKYLRPSDLKIIMDKEDIAYLCFNDEKI